MPFLMQPFPFIWTWNFHWEYTGLCILKLETLLDIYYSMSGVPNQWVITPWGVEEDWLEGHKPLLETVWE